MIGSNRIDSSSSRWRNAYYENGVIVLDNTRRKSSGSPYQRDIRKDELT